VLHRKESATGKKVWAVSPPEALELQAHFTVCIISFGKVEIGKAMR